MSAALFLVVGLVFGAPSSAADAAAGEAAGKPGHTYARTARVTYIEATIAALRATTPETLAKTEDYVGYIERNRCRSTFDRLRIECMINAAARRCRGDEEQRQRCLLFSDIIIANRTSAKRFISTSERYGIMKRHRRFRQELRSELRRRYAALVTNFVLACDFDCAADNLQCLAGGIDDFCRANADARALAWQYCVAAITWSIGVRNGATSEP